MRRTVFLFPVLVFALSGCVLLESPVGPDARPVAPVSSPPQKQEVHKKPVSGKTTLHEAVESSMKHDPELKPDKEVRPDPYVPPPKTVMGYPMKTDHIRGTSEVYRSLNAGRNQPDYLQTKPREREPFFDTVNRTGSNPMNTRDITTNRRVPR